MPLMGVGWNRPSAVGYEFDRSVSSLAEPFEGQLPRFSPEQICLVVGRGQALVLLAWAKALVALEF
jgi:hypothetical protein